jgi:hypothetical protein
MFGTNIKRPLLLPDKEDIKILVILYDCLATLLTDVGNKIA